MHESRVCENLVCLESGGGGGDYGTNCDGACVRKLACLRSVVKMFASHDEKPILVVL